MYCGNCGKEIVEGANYCGRCGTKIEVNTGGTQKNDDKIEKPEKPNGGGKIPPVEKPEKVSVDGIKGKVNETLKKLPKIKEGRGLVSTEFYDLILLITVMGYAVIGGGLGYIIFGRYDSEAFGYVMLGAILGVGVGAIQIMIAKLLLIIAKNVHSITNNLVVINKNIENLYPEEKKDSEHQNEQISNS